MKYERLKATLQKSYYGKATICRSEDGVTLYSYNTAVAWIDNNGAFHRIWTGYSRTSAKHINDFRLLYGLPTISKKEWEAMPASTDDETYNVYLSNGFVTHKCSARLTAQECENELYKIRKNQPHCYAWYD